MDSVLRPMVAGYKVLVRLVGIKIEFIFLNRGKVYSIKYNGYKGGVPEENLPPPPNPLYFYKRLFQNIKAIFISLFVLLR